MNYPLDLSFKLLALANQIAVTDAQGTLIFYVKQKMFKLKEAVTVFADKEQQRQLYSINADRVMDFSARYQIATANGESLGSVKRQGMKSLWKARYDISDGAVSFKSDRRHCNASFFVLTLAGRRSVGSGMIGSSRCDGRSASR